MTQMQWDQLLSLDAFTINEQIAPGKLGVAPFIKIMIALSFPALSDAWGVKPKCTL